MESGGILTEKTIPWNLLRWPSGEWILPMLDIFEINNDDCCCCSNPFFKPAKFRNQFCKSIFNNANSSLCHLSNCPQKIKKGALFFYWMNFPKNVVSSKNDDLTILFDRYYLFFWRDQNIFVQVKEQLRFNQLISEEKERPLLSFCTKRLWRAIF